MRGTLNGVGEDSSRSTFNSHNRDTGSQRTSRVPPDDRTAEEKEEDERAEEKYWEDCLQEGYDAARDHARSDEGWRWLSWGRKIWRALTLRF